MQKNSRVFAIQHDVEFGITLKIFTKVTS